MTKSLRTLALAALVLPGTALAIDGQDVDGVVPEGQFGNVADSYDAEGTFTVGNTDFDTDGVFLAVKGGAEGELTVYDTAKGDLVFDVVLEIHDGWENIGLSLTGETYDGWADCAWAKGTLSCDGEIEGPRGTATLGIVIDITGAG